MNTLENADNISAELRRTLRLAALLASMLTPIAATAQQRSPFLSFTHEYDSGVFDGEAGGVVERAWTLIDQPGATAIRLVFANADLGANSRLMIRSLADGGEQVFNAELLAEWGLRSAFFNGDSVEVALYVDPRDRGIHYSLREVLTPDPMYIADAYNDGARSQCGGADTRAASGDSAVGRLNFNCTGWLAANGAFLTAGHCHGSGGSLGGAILEFNVPPSCLDGSLVMANPADQYPVTGTVRANFPAAGTTNCQDDWCLFQLGRNANGRFPHSVQSFKRLTSSNNASNIQVTGCGADWNATGCAGAGGGGCPANCYGGPAGPPMPAVPPRCRCAVNDATCGTAANPFLFDCNTANQTLQTDSGPYDSRSTSGGFDALSYIVDTEPANSGSPVLNDDAGDSFRGVALGIHNTGGCTTAGAGSNCGTGFQNTELTNAIKGWRLDADFNDANDPPVRYADNGHPDCDTSFIDYDLYDPACKALDAYNNIPNGPTRGFVRIVEGTYRESFPLLNKFITIQAPVGGVLLGLPITATGEGIAHAAHRSKLGPVR